MPSHNAGTSYKYLPKRVDCDRASQCSAPTVQFRSWAVPNEVLQEKLLEARSVAGALILAYSC